MDLKQPLSSTIRSNSCSDFLLTFLVCLQWPGKRVILSDLLVLGINYHHLLGFPKSYNLFLFIAVIFV